MRTKREIKALYIFFALLLLFTAIFGGHYSMPALAATISTNALEDLQRDETFDPNEYPDDASNYTIKVIQIAESTAGELIVYTYQPCQKTTYLVATDINMSLSESVDGTTLYGLTLLNCNGVFAKYVVNNFSIGAAEKRFYNITSILREHSSELDGKQQIDNVVNKVAFSVGKLFIAQTVKGEIYYSEREQEIITITDKYVGNIMYVGEVNVGWGLSQNSVNAMYVAFDTDKPISQLYEADVTYTTKSLQYKVKTNFLQFWNKSSMGSVYDIEEGAPEPHAPVTLSCDKTVEGNNTWKQIQSVEEFKANIAKNEMELTTDAQEGLKGKKWVLNFASVDVEMQGGDGMWLAVINPVGMAFAKDPSFRTTRVSNVSVLRLKFEYEGKVYDLGAVDGMSTGSNKPSNRLPGYDENNENFSIGRWIKDKATQTMPGWAWILVAVGVVLVVIIILGVCFPAFGKILLIIVKGIGRMFAAPIKGIAALAERNERQRQLEKATESKSYKPPRSKSTAKKAGRKSTKRSRRK